MCSALNWCKGIERGLLLVVWLKVTYAAVLQLDSTHQFTSRQKGEHTIIQRNPQKESLIIIH